MTSPRLKIVFIAGWGRSGTTILGNALNEIDGWIHTGEIVSAWDRGLIENRVTGSGTPFSEDPFWTAVFDRAFGGMDQVDAQRAVKLKKSIPPNRRIAAGLMTGSRPSMTDHQEYVGMMRALYQGVQQESGCRVIVDSSKFPSHAYLLSSMEDVDLHLVHVIRDARASAFSWLRKKYSADIMHEFGASRSALKWDVWNLIFSRLGAETPERYALVKYEEFIKNPGETLKAIQRTVGETNDLHFLEGATLHLNGNHTVWGNPNRTAGGSIELRLDDEWRASMKRTDKALVTALTFPWLMKYKYPLSSSRDT